MLFDTFEYWIFFAASVLLLAALRPTAGKWLLVAASYVFYAFWDVRFVFLLGASTLANLVPFPAASSAIASRVAALGTLTSKGRRRSSAIRSISSRIASEIESPIAPSAAVARSFVVLSILART